MQRARKLYISICDYNKNVVCDLYDNQSDISGQATDVNITTERNGWKELTFDIPSSCMGENGLEDNYRLNYLIAEYKIKVVTDTETDWYIISEPHITHSGFSKNVSVKAGHVSQTLKSKNMDLEFSDDEGNNVGTAEQILTTILEGSGWHVGYVETFKEDDGSVKVRSISGQAGSGALNFIEQLCDVFDAKPIYHGEGQTVDIVSMNPFKEIDPERIPYELVDEGNVIELHYNRNTHDLNKTTNTDNMATRLYAYGSSGDLNGICTLQTAEHSEYRFTVSQTGAEYCFEDLSGKRHFFTGNVSANNILVYSDMDLTSQLYIWNETKQKAYPLYDKPTTTYVTLTNPEYVVCKNYFPYLLGLEYYYNVGLMTDEQFQQVARFQRDLPVLYQAAQESAEAYIQGEQELSRIAEHNTGLLKLKIRERSSDARYAKLMIDTSENNGIIYRTDYDVAERKFFQWHVAKKLQENGDPVSGTPSVLLVIHNTNPVTWDKVYLKYIYDNNSQKVVDDNNEPADFKYSTGGYPTAITVWSEDLRWSANDRVYLFCTNSMSGLLGSRMSEDEAVIENLYNKTDKHNTYFWNADSTDPMPSPRGEDFEWLYGFHTNINTVGDFYFCWQAKGDTVWRNVYMQTSVPAVRNDAYFYHLKYKTLWHGENGSWVQCDSAAEQRVADHFTKVFYYCRKRDMYYKGLYEYYTHACVNLPTGNYAFPTNYAFYWTFKTKSNTVSTLKLDTVNGYVIPDGNIANVYTASAVPFETVTYPLENEIAEKGFYLGTIDIQSGVELDSKTRYRSSTVKVYESVNYTYSLPSGCFVCFYDVNLKFLSGLAIGGTGNFTTPPRARYIRLGSPVQNPGGYVRMTKYNEQVYINEEFYTILNATPSASPNELIGINPLMSKFADLADTTYSQYLNTMIVSQETITSSTNSLTENLCDMIKDGRWQDSNYVAGDEKRLYDDAMDMLRQVSMPEIEYSFTFLDMYGVQNKEFESEWPDIEITDAAHLVDTEINTNCWAYIDKIVKCYDKPWETTVDIDTKLTLAARHGFTDVIARIAEVAKEISSKKSEWDEAYSGKVTGSRLEGMILLNQAYLNGGTSNWYTDEKGNIIFEAADGLSAMILGGRGLGVANSKNEDGTWQWRTAATGYGLTADEITTGHLDAELITARSITADKLMSNVGQELEISSNKALTIFATEDGSRPAGTVHTTDALIDIRAGYTDENQNVIPAVITVASGGELNLTGGDVNITSNGKLNVESSGEFKLVSKGANLNTTTDGIYIANDGINMGGGKFKVTFSGDTSTVRMDASSVVIGSVSSDTLQSALNDIEDAAENAQAAADDAQRTADSKTQTYRCTSAQIVYEPYFVGDRWINTDNDFLYTYICVQASSPRNSTTDWQLERTAITKGAALDIDAVHGNINMVAANSISMAAGANINIAAGQTLNLLASNASNNDGTSPTGSGGKVLIGNSSSPFTVGSDYYTFDSNTKYRRAYIYNGRTNIQQTNTSGVYLGTDGLNIGKTSGSYIIATAAGNIDISGKITATSGKIGDFTINSALYSSTKSTINTDVNGVYLGSDGIGLGRYVNVGSSQNPVYKSKFQVNNDGTLYADSATLKGSVTASSGKIGDFTINSALYTNSKSSIDANVTGVYIGSDGISLGARVSTSVTRSKFKVTNEGKLYANDAEITATISGGSITIGSNFSVDSSGNLTASGANISGTITASYGSIAGWNINSTTMSKYITNTQGQVLYSIGLDTSNDTDVPVIWAGNTYYTSQMQFHVNKDGSLYSTRGNIAGWDINTYTFGKRYENSDFYNVEMGSEGVYVGFWMGSNDASKAPLAMVVNHDTSKSDDTFWYKKSGRYSLTAGAYYWAYWENTGTEEAPDWKFKYYRFDMDKLWNDNYIIHTAID